MSFPLYFLNIAWISATGSQTNNFRMKDKMKGVNILSL